MVNIECTRCGATGTDYPTLYVAKFSLKHETGCGAKIGIPKYTEGTVQTKPVVEQETLLVDPEKPKKKKAKKKKVEENGDTNV